MSESQVKERVLHASVMQSLTERSNLQLHGALLHHPCRNRQSRMQFTRRFVAAEYTDIYNGHMKIANCSPALNWNTRVLNANGRCMTTPIYGQHDAVYRWLSVATMEVKRKDWHAARKFPHHRCTDCRAAIGQNALPVRCDVINTTQLFHLTDLFVAVISGVVI